jgi:hypothetical protein
MNVKTYEVVKQYIFVIEEAPFIIKGRVSHNLDSNDPRPFMWEISHYYSHSQGAYLPSKIQAETFKDAEAFLLLYAKAFTNIGIEPNESF